MKLFYITNSRFPTEKAHGIQIAKMIEALTEGGLKVKLIIPGRENPLIRSAEEYYGLRVPLEISKFPTIDLLWKLRKVNIDILETLAGLIQTLTFYIFVYFWSLKNPKVIIYTRDHYSMAFYHNMGRVVWEVHELPKVTMFKKLYLKLAEKAGHVVCVNKAVYDFFTKNGLGNNKINLLPNGVDLRMFQSTRVIKKSSEWIVGYIGSLYRRKGVDTLIDSVKYLTSKYKTIIYGGPADERKRLLKNHTIFSTVEYKLVPEVLKTMDILVIPNSSEDPLSSQETSPLKLYEFLATGKPVIMSDVPSLRELVPGNMDGVYWFTSDDSVSLAKAINEAAKSKMRYYKRDLTNYSLDYRALKIKEICKRLWKK